MPSSGNFAKILEEARAASALTDLVEIQRHGTGAHSLHGFAMGVGATLLLLHSLSDRLDLDGYVAVQLDDVTSISSDFPKKSFYLKALELKGISPSEPPQVDLSDFRSLLRSVARKFPLVVIHREHLFPDECEIGRIKITSETTYSLRWITPTAEWEDDDRTFRYSDITLVGFDGEYERTLALVAQAADQGTG